MHFHLLFVAHVRPVANSNAFIFFFLLMLLNERKKQCGHMWKKKNYGSFAAFYHNAKTDEINLTNNFF